MAIVLIMIVVAIVFTVSQVSLCLKAWQTPAPEPCPEQDTGDVLTCSNTDPDNVRLIIRIPRSSLGEETRPSSAVSPESRTAFSPDTSLDINSPRGSTGLDFAESSSVSPVTDPGNLNSTNQATQIDPVYEEPRDALLLQPLLLSPGYSSINQVPTSPALPGLPHLSPSRRDATGPSFAPPVPPRQSLVPPEPPAADYPDYPSLGAIKKRLTRKRRIRPKMGTRGLRPSKSSSSLPDQLASGAASLMVHETHVHQPAARKLASKKGKHNVAARRSMTPDYLPEEGFTESRLAFIKTHSETFL